MRRQPFCLTNDLFNECCPIISEVLTSKINNNDSKENVAERDVFGSYGLDYGTSLRMDNDPPKPACSAVMTMLPLIAKSVAWLTKYNAQNPSGCAHSVADQ